MPKHQYEAMQKRAVERAARIRAEFRKRMTNLMTREQGESDV